MKSFSATECVDYGWRTFKLRPWFLVMATIIMLTIAWIVSTINMEAGKGFVQMFAISIAALIVQTLVDMGLTNFALKAGDDVDSVELSDLWYPHSFWNFLIAIFPVGVAIVLGLVAFIIPGVILALMFFFVKFLIIDRDMAPIEAMKESIRITKGHRFELLVFLLLIIALNVVGLACFGVGLLVSLPVSSLAMVRAYRLLEHEASELVPMTVSVTVLEV